MRGSHLISGALVTLVILILGDWAGVPPYVLAPVAISLGVAIVAEMRTLERGITLPIGWGWWLWGALLPVCVAAAVWAEETANEGCSATDNDAHRVLVTLALVAIGVGASWLPARGLQLIVSDDRVWHRVGFLFMSAVWLATWSFFWFVVWRLTFGCVD
ncbi:MAG: hypothetical protein GTN93_31965 [Anaerolineae bacterium]|nr:hypothetical protein [Anaerolineae bacterium]